MHLLQTQPGSVSDGSEAVDLAQSPGELLILSAADSELACLARAAANRPAAIRSDENRNAPSVRVANLLQLQHPLSVDLYVERMVPPARLVIVRLLGGLAYWPYGLEQIAAACRQHGVPLAALPGDDKPDESLATLSTVSAEAYARLWAYLSHGGADNAAALLAYAADLVRHERDPWPVAAWREPAPLPRAGLYWPGLAFPSLADLRRHWQPERPVALVLFYRALLQAGDLAPIDALIEALAARGLNALPLAAISLKHRTVAETTADLIAAGSPAVILNLTGFALSTPDDASAGPAVFRQADCPVLQVILAGTAEETWRADTQGLPSRDVAMSVALPELDGRIASRAIAFKAAGDWNQTTECRIVGYRPVPDRVAFVAEQAARWVRLRRTPAAERRIALVLANYPNRDGRLANGVGLDTPESVARALHALAAEGYAVAAPPADGAALMRTLTGGVTNDLTALDARTPSETLSLSAYRTWFATLPQAVREAVTARWGAPEADPYVRTGAFRLPVHRYGAVAVAVQPARGYNIDPVATYHAPDLPPPHHYLAFYLWLRAEADAGGFDAHAVVHFGKHGNLEWLPGKALALTQACFPEVALGPLPNLYPFIVNDPGEGCQAKRRTSAVILDHLTPPLTRAETYGPLRELERLVDEYFEASTLDARRLPALAESILELAARTGLDRDCGIGGDDSEGEALTKLDAWLCEIKEMQIRGGLHVFGRTPMDSDEHPDLTDLLVALTRLPRGRGDAGDASILRALAQDLDLDFDPLDGDPAAPLSGAEIACLRPLPGAPAILRSRGDAVETLEALAQALVAGRWTAPEIWSATQAVLETIATRLRPAVAACGPAETAALLRGLDGRFIPPGPSGAPSRGRPEVLPTGRNFYAVDPRAVPTPAAWTLGWRSAALVIERYVQDHGDWPRSFALSAWGTANMRTGGDDIAQALAFMGVRPTWDGGTGRVTGFEILPASVLDRPRIDVTVRVSGFFRDAFPFQLDLLDSAARAVAALTDEPPAQNPIAAAVAAETARLRAAGLAETEATRRAGHRVFGSKPGAYGAGLQALIDEGGWSDTADLAEAYLSWGGYAYGGGAGGAAERDALETRLQATDAVLHNQDNREHDLLDSDDYYQFEGGLAAAVATVSGRAPAVYHQDHSRPERPQVRALDEEIARVVRARVVNPKWIAGVLRHGYKGAFELAATVDYLFAFAATTGAVKDHHFDAVYQAYIEDDAVRATLAEANPTALKEMAARLQEAQARALWQPASNSAYPTLAKLACGQAENEKAEVGRFEDGGARP